MSEIKDQQSKNLEYLSHFLRNGTANIQGCMKEIEKQVKIMIEAVNTYKKDLEDEHKLPNGENSKVE